MMGMDFSDSEDEDNHKSQGTPVEESKSFQNVFGMNLKSQAKLACLGQSQQNIQIEPKLSLEPAINK